MASDLAVTPLGDERSELMTSLAAVRPVTSLWYRCGTLEVPCGEPKGKVKLRTAWKHGSLPKPKILKGHKQSISMIRMSGDLLATVSWDKNVKIWKKLSSRPR